MAVRKIPVRKIPVLGWVAVGLATVTGGVLALLPCSYAGVSTRTSIGARGATQTVSRSCQSLVDANGAGVLIALFVPTGLALIAALGFAARRRAVFITATVVLGVLCVLTGFSIGMFFFPTVAVLAIASATWSTRPG
jgi:hypothetical protein